MGVGWVVALLALTTLLGLLGCRLAAVSDFEFVSVFVVVNVVVAWFNGAVYVWLAPRGMRNDVAVILGGVVVGLLVLLAAVGARRSGTSLASTRSLAGRRSR